jgi:hypothetical protein
MICKAYKTIKSFRITYYCTFIGSSFDLNVFFLILNYDLLLEQCIRPFSFNNLKFRL